jgi:hypothetical protein
MLGIVARIRKNIALFWKHLSGPPRLGRSAGVLGVRYILEGSVRRSANRLRINAQLVDATDGHHLWAERYDREIAEIFALQDEITEKIVAALQVKLTEGEQEQMARRYTKNLEAYDHFLRGRDQVRATNVTNAQARAMFERAIELSFTRSCIIRFLYKTCPKGSPLTPRC